jgi:hypothetical protein
MELQTDFETFLEEIRPTKNMRDDCRNGHLTLRERLNADEDLQPILVSDFLQGSYRRSTAVRPKNGNRSDVDIIVVTNLSEEKYSPKEAMAKFEPFLNRYYKDKWRPQGRSFGIELSYVDMDLVITSAPSEVDIALLESDAVKSIDELAVVRDWRLNNSWLSLISRASKNNARQLLEFSAQEQEWKSKPLRIPDRNAGTWEDTHPLEQIRVTRDKNKNTNYHFVNVVKSIKWWWLSQFEETKSPKGFPLERFVGECCPDSIYSVAEGLVKTLENISIKYGVYVTLNSKPTLPDYGVPSHDVFKRVTASEFAVFYQSADKAAKLARKAFESKDRTESGNLWRELLGEKFPKPPENNGGENRGYILPDNPATPGSGRFA